MEKELDEALKNLNKSVEDLKEIAERFKVCEECNGTGVVDEDDLYQGNEVSAKGREKKCICQLDK